MYVCVCVCVCVRERERGGLVEERGGMLSRGYSTYCTCTKYTGLIHVHVLAAYILHLLVGDAPHW